MTYMKSGSPFLYDEDSGDIVGVKDRDGGESFFGRLSTDANGNTVLAGADGVPVYLRTEYVDLREWSGLDLTGNNDNSAILQAAINETAYKYRADFGFGASLRLFMPAGRIAFSTPLVLKQNLWLEGVFGADGGTVLVWGGADGVDALANIPSMDTSMVNLCNFELEDARLAPTSGRGIALNDFNNGVSLRRLMLTGFPREQIYIGADSGHAGDCTEIFDIWLNSSKPEARGILLERLDNNIIINNIKSDIATSPSNDGYVIRTQSMPSDGQVIEISNVKHESNNRCPTLSFNSASRGNLSIRNIVQRNPIGGAAGAGDVIQFGAAASASAYWKDNTSTGVTTGAVSEGGGRTTIENVTGANHSDWTGASGAATIRMLGSGVTVYGAVSRALVGTSGRVVRELASNGIPNGTFYGNIGDTYRRLDAVSITAAFWVKEQGTATNTGWVPTKPETQSVAFAASLSVNLQLGNRVSVAAMTAALTHNSPTNVPIAGVRVEYLFVQNETGGYGITWSSLHKGTSPTASGTANQKQSVRFISDGTNLVFESASGWY